MKIAAVIVNLYPTLYPNGVHGVHIFRVGYMNQISKMRGRARGGVPGSRGGVLGSRGPVFPRFKWSGAWIPWVYNVIFVTYHKFYIFLKFLVFKGRQIKLCDRIWCHF